MNTDSLIRYGEESILKGVEPTLMKASVAGGVYTIEPGGLVTFNLGGKEAKISKSAKNIMFDYKFSTSSRDNYSKKVGFNVYLVYSDYTNQIDKFVLGMVGWEASAVGFLGGNELNTRGFSFSRIVIEIYNESDTVLTVRDLGVYKSIDLQFDQLLEVLEQDAVSIDTLMAKSAWIENMQVEVLETNTKAKSVKWGSASNRDYITIKENAMTLGIETLDKDAVVQLQIDINGTMTPVWYTAINENKYAYKFVTINHPREYIPDITDEEAQNYAYMVYKSTNQVEKMKIEIIGGSPRIVFGAGSGADMSGRGVIQKDADTFKIEKYANGANSVATGVYMRDSGSYLTGFDTLPSKVEISYNHINVVKPDGTSIGFNVITDSVGNIQALESSTGKVIQFFINM